jgi:5'-nucleotidase
LKPLVLVTNDDGVGSEGILRLAQAMAAHADVVVCAPRDNQSATSHSLTLSRVLRLREVGPGRFAVDGTPADSVFVALESEGRVLPRVPDLCLSGINHGLNLGVDVFYSGTVAAAREAALRGIPALALSADSGTDLEAAAAVSVRLALALLEASPGVGRLLNVNFPPGRSWTARTTIMGRRTYEGGVSFRKDPRGADYLWIGGSSARHHDAPGSDTEAFDEGVVGITPLALDLTAKDAGVAAALALALGDA